MVAKQGKLAFYLGVVQRNRQVKVSIRQSATLLKHTRVILGSFSFRCKYRGIGGPLCNGPYGREATTDNSVPVFAAVAFAQTVPLVLDIEVENGVRYVADVTYPPVHDQTEVVCQGMGKKGHSVPPREKPPAPRR